MSIITIGRMVVVDEFSAQRSALDEPRTPVGARWIGYWTLAQFGMYGAFYAVSQVTLPVQAGQVTGGSESASVDLIAIATAFSAVFTIVASFLVGVYSDRTLSARGRRQPWVVVGALIMGAALIAQGFVTSEVGVVVAWSVVAIGYGTMIAALLAVVPDEVPVGQRATVSGFFGISVSAGQLLCIALVALVVTDVAQGLAVLGVLVMLLAVPFAFGTRGVRLRPSERPALSLGAALKGVVEPLKHADFAWAWSGRFFIQLSNALAQVFLFLYLEKFIGHDDPMTGTFILTAVYTVAVVLVTVPAGRISDRTLKRKRMVVVSSVLQGLAGLVFAFLPEFTWTVVGAAVLGIGYGIYAAVDQALVTQVLPHPEDRGKDLGVINIANIAPYVLAALVGGFVINAFGYPTLMVLVLVTALIAAATVQPIKSVR